MVEALPWIVGYCLMAAIYIVLDLLRSSRTGTHITDRQLFWSCTAGLFWPVSLCIILVIVSLLGYAGLRICLALRGLSPSEPQTAERKRV